jgi:hypothetical protein
MQLQHNVIMTFTATYLLPLRFGLDVGYLLSDAENKPKLKYLADRALMAF